MNRESAVQFATDSRIHIALAVRELENSVTFYRTLFGEEPTKTRPGYAKFEVAEPPINLALNSVGGETGPNNEAAHFGIQVKSTAAVAEFENRFAVAGVATRDEKNVDCCYAVQDKFWATDPDGNRWEVFVVLDDAGTSHSSVESTACCSEVEPMESAFSEEAVASAETAYLQGSKDSGCCTPTGNACCTPAVS